MAGIGKVAGVIGLIIGIAGVLTHNEQAIVLGVLLAGRGVLLLSNASLAGPPGFDLANGGEVAWQGIPRGPRSKRGGQR
jgi:hypothetical protein